MNLTDGPLRGEVTWNGDLIGFRPDDTRDGTGDTYYTVTGTAQIRVDLSTLNGDALFGQLEASPSVVPGAVGTGSLWGDGDLEYDIAVRGNTFHQTGGDDGELTGILTGKHHEGTAGTLERQDLTAAFGASRTPPKGPRPDTPDLTFSQGLTLKSTGSYSAGSEVVTRVINGSFLAYPVNAHDRYM